MSKGIIVWSLSILSVIKGFAQEPHKHFSQEANSLNEIFREGEVEGHIRNYFLSTMNYDNLKDYYANATGGALSFRTKPYKGFEFGVKGIFTYKTFSSKLSEVDRATGKASKWEYELYDVLDKENFNDLDRLEELYIKYYFNDSHISFGKIDIKDTPLLNKSDGRMKPFSFEGVWGHFSMGANQKVNMSWLYKVSPRSTTEWFQFNDVLGLSSNGYQTNGEVAAYHEKIDSKGVGIFNYEASFHNVSVDLYYWYIDKVIHTSWLEVAYDLSNSWSVEAQYTYQVPHGHQSDLAFADRFVQPHENGQVFSAKLQYKKQHLNVKVGYTHAFDSGRFLFPRELGRDRFYTSVSRARLEGFGKADVLTLSGYHNLNLKGFKLGVEFTRLFGPKIGNYEFNKYNLDEFYQLNTRLHYELDGFFKGLSFDVLYVFKENINDTSLDVIFNRSNYHQINFITNFKF